MGVEEWGAIAYAWRQWLGQADVFAPGVKDLTGV